MLSVQSPGCAGMERLGGGGTAGGGGAAGGAGGTRKRRDLNDLSMAQLKREMGLLMELQVRARCVQTSEQLNCPHRIQLPDGEGGPDRHLQLRVPHQQSELTRSAMQPPPNKSVLDVPEWAAPPPPCLAPSAALPPPHKPPSPHKKDGFVQKAVKYLVKIGGGKAPPEGEVPQPPPPPAPAPPPPAAPPAPCVMVPLRPPPAPSPHAPPS